MSQTKELANFYYISLTDKGMVRSRNEDYLGYFDTVNGHVFVVCDGIGGLPCGDKASQTVVNSVKFFFSNFYYRDVNNALEDALDYAQNRIFEEARIDNSCAGMGSTVVLALVRNNKIYFAYMGDSRIYYMHNRKLQRLTEDDSYVQQLVNEGKITQKEAEIHPRKNELIRAMGMTPTQKPHVCRKPISPSDGDLLLLCTDGLYNMVGEQDIQATLAKRGYIESKGMELMKNAIKNGGKDNITLQLVKFYNVNNFTDGHKKHYKFNAHFNVKIFIVVLLLATLIGVYYMRQVHNNNQDFVMANDKKVEFVKIQIESPELADSLLEVFNVASKDAIIIIANKKNFVQLPVKKIFTTRYYDNLAVLEKLYGTSAQRIKKANKLNNEPLAPGIKIIIPY